MKRPGTLLRIFFPLPFLVSFGCVSNTGEKSITKEQSPSVENQGPVVTGQQEYIKYCLACHQENGYGVRGQFPPLAGNEVVTNQADSLIKIVLSGLEGPITVNGQQYNEVMPAQDYLSDQQISDVLTYIRNAWGNKAPAVSTEQVKTIRDEVTH